MKKQKQHKPLQWQPIGWRIVKTGLAVTLCMYFYMLLGFRGESMPAEAAITAIICLQADIQNSGRSALNRFAGTMIGATWGFLFLLLVLFFPALGKNLYVLYLMMGIGTLICLHTAVVLRQQDAAGLAAIVFVCVVIAYPDIPDPMAQAFHRLLDMLVGIVTALVINAARLPRRQLHNKVFFVRLQDLAADQFSRLAPTVLYRLQSLWQEQAKICLISEHAPAFHLSQLDSVRFTVPLIVMDGAALYDPNENVYLSVTHLDAASCHWLVKRLETMGVSYFIYTVHRDRNCIYHHGELRADEREVYLHLKKSPYRYYLDTDHYSAAEVVYLKIVTTKEEAERIRNDLQRSLEKMKLRAVVRPQAGLENGWSLYFYAAHADVKHAQTHLMQLLRQEEPGLEPYDMVSRAAYRSEHDAVRLLRELDREFEPTILHAWLSCRKESRVKEKQE